MDDLDGHLSTDNGIVAFIYDTHAAMSQNGPDLIFSYLLHGALIVVDLNKIYRLKAARMREYA